MGKLPREQEVKYALDAPINPDGLGWNSIDCTLESKGTVSMQSTYWDTDTLALLNAGWALRFRTDEGWVMKHDNVVDGTFHSRIEEHGHGPATEVPHDFKQTIVQALTGDELHPNVSFATSRDIYNVMQRGLVHAEIAVDTVTVHHKRGTSVFYEVEVEVKHGNDTIARSVALMLEEAFHLHVAPLSKYAHAAQLAGITPSSGSEIY